jgi:hypothetical protein
MFTGSLEDEPYRLVTDTAVTPASSSALKRSAKD